MHHVVRSILVIALLASVAGAGQEKKTSPETRERMLALISTLELDPFNADGKAYRSEVLLWLTEATDVHVEICTNLLGDLKRLTGDEGSILVAQLAFSEAKFVLEHPAQAKDRHAVSAAGLDGVLRTYVAMKMKKPDLTFETMDKLIQLQAEDKFDAYVDKALKGCKQ